jgi:exodeoxyribonuclease VII large subunit
MILPEGVRPLSISQLTTAMKLRLEEHFAQVWAVGEISGFKHHTSDHRYFTLKDAKAVIRCMMRAGFANRLRFVPTDGMQVLVRGAISLYEPRGDCQLYVEELEPKGIGAAELALRQLREKLRAKGYFDPDRKRPITPFPKYIALMASPTGAAIRDMLELLSQLWPMTKVLVQPCRVQGEGAAQDVAEKLHFLSRLKDLRKVPLDAIVLGRGGGSIEDLWAFNEECVADAIFRCTVPVISAIGHETNVTIADLVADHRAETPSAAITQLVPNQHEIRQDLLERESRLRELLRLRLAHARQRLDQLAQRPSIRKPLDLLKAREQQLLIQRDRLQSAATRLLEQAHTHLASRAEQLEGLSPLNVLKRGYSLTTTPEGKVIHRAEQVQVEEIILTRLNSGTLRSRVLDVSAEEST